MIEITGEGQGSNIFCFARNSCYILRLYTTLEILSVIQTFVIINIRTSIYFELSINFKLPTIDTSSITDKEGILSPHREFKVTLYTSGLNDVFPPDDLVSGPYPQFIIICIPCITAAF